MSTKTTKTFDEIECPKCGHSIPVSEALRHQLAEELKEQIDQKEKDFLIREKELKDKEIQIKEQGKDVEKRVEKEVSAAVLNREKILQEQIDKKEKSLSERNIELKDRETQLKAREESIEKRVATAVSSALIGREQELKDRETQLFESERSVEKRVKDTVDQERVKLEADAKKKAEEAISVEMQDAKLQLQEIKEKLKLAEKTELDLRKRERELEEKQQNIELETARRLSALKSEVEESVSKKFAEEHRLKDHEKEKIIQDLKVALEDANRKAQQGSQQLQGEVQELDIEAILKEQFPHDEIMPVPKGIRGADALQIVKMPSGTVCGSILWESKRRKNWSETWIKKLKDDQREAKADIAVIISEVLPKDLPNSGCRDRIWIGNYFTLRLLSVALRMSLVGVASAKLASGNKDEISDLLFRYVTGSEFRQKIEAIIDTYKDMRETIDRDKRASIARWSKQEKQIEKVIAITAGTYGELRGLIGPSMQSIPALEAGDESDITKQEDITEGTVPAKTISESILEEDEEINPDDIPF